MPSLSNRAFLKRLFVLAACGGVIAGCNATPASLGITGPGASTRAAPIPASGDDSAITDPGNPVGFGSTYSPSTVPTYGGNGRFYGYN